MKMLVDSVGGPSPSLESDAELYDPLPSLHAGCKGVVKFCIILHGSTICDAAATLDVDADASLCRGRCVAVAVAAAAVAVIFRLMRFVGDAQRRHDQLNS